MRAKWARPGWEGRAEYVLAWSFYTILIVFLGKKPKPSLHPPFVIRKPLGGSAVCAHVYIYMHKSEDPFLARCLKPGYVLLILDMLKATASAQGCRQEKKGLKDASALKSIDDTVFPLTCVKLHSQKMSAQGSIPVSQPCLQACTCSNFLTHSSEQQSSPLLIDLNQKQPKTPALFPASTLVRTLCPYSSHPIEK